MKKDLGEIYLENVSGEDHTPFMEGNCALLALKINEYTGWPINILSNPDGESWSEDDDLEFTHVVVEHPSGKYLDAGGLRTNQEISNEFGLNFMDSYDISSEQLRKLISDPDGPFDIYLSDQEVDTYAKNLLNNFIKKDLSQIYTEMYWNDPDDGMFSRELLEKATISDKFALNDYSKLIYEQTHDIFNYLEELINEGSHGDEKIVKLALKDAYKKGLIDIQDTKSGWIVKSKKDGSMETIHKGERAFHYLRRFLQKLEGLT